MKRKRFEKLAMSCGVSKRDAQKYAKSRTDGMGYADYWDGAIGATIRLNAAMQNVARFAMFAAENLEEMIRSLEEFVATLPDASIEAFIDISS